MPGERIKASYDRTVDAFYAQLRDVPKAYGRSLDKSRRIDYGKDGKPIGVELLSPSRGVNLDGLPKPHRLRIALLRFGLPVRP